jgi:hypothetical protein
MNGKIKLIKVKDFKRFLNSEVVPAADELDTLQDRNRKHIEKLVYTNCVDRFDALIDSIILKNCKHDYLAEKALRDSEKQITEADLIKRNIKSDSLDAVTEELLQDKLRLTIMKQRHSKKLNDVFSLLSVGGDLSMKPRVNPSNGNIKDSFKIQKRDIPNSVSGYAHWLYSRRNGVVHGLGGATYFDNDRHQIKGFMVSTSPRRSRSALLR